MMYGPKSPLICGEFLPEIKHLNNLYPFVASEVNCSLFWGSPGLESQVALRINMCSVGEVSGKDDMLVHTSA